MAFYHKSGFISLCPGRLTVTVTESAMRISCFSCPFSEIKGGIVFLLLALLEFSKSSLQLTPRRRRVRQAFQQLPPGLTVRLRFFARCLREREPKQVWRLCHLWKQDQRGLRGESCAWEDTRFGAPWAAVCLVASSKTLALLQPGSFCAEWEAPPCLPHQGVRGSY